MLIYIPRALYLRGDPYEKSDAVFGVKESLIIDLGKVSDVKGLAEKHSVSQDTKLLKYDFVLVSEKDTMKLRDEKALESIEKLGMKGLTVIDNVVVPDVD